MMQVKFSQQPVLPQASARHGQLQAGIIENYTALSVQHVWKLYAIINVPFLLKWSDKYNPKKVIA